ncbi:MAG: CAP domain-containing protein [Leptolyngbyaceae cyanobacterium bins.349]|nr:CAP domain-containing protein [Leptolyngbyaceae cyanobacterium bins.349]
MSTSSNYSMTRMLALVLAGATLAVTGATLRASAQNSMAQEILNAHNKARSEVRVSPLTWSNQLAREAQAWANNLASRNARGHSEGKTRPGQGENIWYGTSGRYSFTDMVNGWKEEKKLYRGGPVTKNNYRAIGHYTQMTWKNTTQVGCGGADGSDGIYRLVCRYSPPGNFLGQAPF